jgi:hypothetical protein
MTGLTSKALLIAVALAGLVLLAVGKLDSVPAQISFGIIGAMALFNRIDSRLKAYRIRVKLPSGAGFSLDGQGDGGNPAPNGQTDHRDPPAAARATSLPTPGGEADPSKYPPRVPMVSLPEPGITRVRGAPPVEELPLVTWKFPAPTSMGYVPPRPGFAAREPFGGGWRWLT